MGWKPGKLLKKAFKGVKKVVKKIGRGIKKVAKGFMKAVGKLGVVGQLGMMFLMPYAFQYIGGWVGQAIGTTGNWLSTTAKALTSSSSIVGKALGHTMNAIYTAGSTMGNVYNSISSTISGAVNTFADATGLGQGYDAVGKFFHEKVVNPTKQLFGFETTAYQPLFTDASGTVKDQDLTKPRNTTSSTVSPDEGPNFLDDLTDEAVTGGARVDPNTGQVVTTEGVPKVVKTSGTSGTDKDVTTSAVKGSPIQNEIEERMANAAYKGAEERLSETVYEGLGGERPDPRYFSSQFTFDNVDLQDTSVFDQVDLTLTRDFGNPFIASNNAQFDATRIINNFDYDDTERLMRIIQGNNSPVYRGPSSSLLMAQ
tara:strand:+ start:2016 stop:3122 length:1107 start_codon:yes stop_codon:yes gene_type:complete